MLTDPWYRKPAFGSWLPVPPLSIPPSYLVSLARTLGEKFVLAISHGHDDHLDDEFLKLFPPSTSVVIPKYGSAGLISRIRLAGLQNINEVGPGEYTQGVFRFASFYNLENSRDDAILTIASSDSLFIHANDNWRAMSDESAAEIRKKVKEVGTRRSIYLSQCNIADGFPYTYPQYSNEEKAQIAQKRIVDMTTSSLKNAATVGAHYFMNYAGHTKTFVNGNQELEKLTGYQDFSSVSSLLKKTTHALEILDMVPGDRFDFVKIHKLFGEVRLDDAILKEESVRFYEHDGVLHNCVTYSNMQSSLTGEQRHERLRRFLLGFYSFISQRIDKTGFRKGIKNLCLTMSDEKSEFIYHLDFSSGELIPQPREPYTHISASLQMLDQILLGKLNIENLTIGGACQIEKMPLDHYSGDINFWLSMYAYVYQRECLGSSSPDKHY